MRKVFIETAYAKRLALV